MCVSIKPSTSTFLIRRETPVNLSLARLLSATVTPFVFQVQAVSEQLAGEQEKTKRWTNPQKTTNWDPVERWAPSPGQN